MKNLLSLFLLSCLVSTVGCSSQSDEQNFVSNLLNELQNPDPTGFVSEFFPTESEFKEFYSGSKIIETNAQTGEVTDMIDEKWNEINNDKHRLFAVLMKQTVNWNGVIVDSVEIAYKAYNESLPKKSYVSKESMVFEMKLFYHQKEDVCDVILHGIRTSRGDFKITKIGYRSCTAPY